MVFTTWFSCVGKTCVPVKVETYTDFKGEGRTRGDLEKVVQELGEESAALKTKDDLEKVV